MLLFGTSCDRAGALVLMYRQFVITTDDVTIDDTIPAQFHSYPYGMVND